MLVLLLVLLAFPQAARAQEDFGWFLAGAATALGVHEGGHVVADLAFGASPGLAKVTFGPIPFFAITHEPVSPAREFTISSVGFWTQHLTSELILRRHPMLRQEDRPFMKGMLAFNILVSAGYATAAFAQAGPFERDTHGIAASARIDEPIVGAMILAPAVLDGIRYYTPDKAWVRWASRAAKVAGVLLVIKAAQ